MRIKEIGIKNFRQYRDLTLSFPSAIEYDLNYVLAENGIGKTTLLNAITWCFYGKELHITEGLKDKTLPLITLKTIREMKTGDEENTVVCITVEDLEGEVTFERWITFRKTEDGVAYEKQSGQKVIKKPNAGAPDVFTGNDEFSSEVNRRLPERIQNFFFFDGEQLDTYLSKTAGTNVEQAVLEISQIDLLKTMEKNLSTISDRLRRNVAKANTKSEEINKQYEDKQKEVSRLETEYEKLHTDLTSAKDDLDDIKRELGDDPDVSELEVEREALDKEIRNELKPKKAAAVEEYKRFLKKYLMLLSALPRLRDMYDYIANKEKNNQLPPKYDKDELENMVKEQHCHVCDRNLDTDSTAFILSLIKRFELGHETGNILSSIQGSIEMLIRDAAQYETSRDRVITNMDLIEDKIKEKSRRIRDLDSIIDKYTDKDRIKKLYLKRADLEKFIEKAIGNEAVKEVELNRAKEEEKALYVELTAALSKDEKFKQLRKESQLAEKSKVRIGVIINSIKSGIRQQISNEMSNKFFELMWKQKFKKVELTEDYTTSVINNDGYECLGSCSAAERELLVLAFTLALHKESGYDGPLVIDTPISRISGDLRIAFAKVLRDVSEKKQIILFVTEDEYSTNVRDVFEPKANRKYKLELVDEDYVKAGEL